MATMLGTNVAVCLNAKGVVGSVLTKTCLSSVRIAAVAHARLVTQRCMQACLALKLPQIELKPPQMQRKLKHKHKLLTAKQ